MKARCASVVPCGAFSTPRGTNVRGAERGSGQRLAHTNVVGTPVVLGVVPVSAAAIPRGTKVRGAGCDSGQRGPAKRGCLCRRGSW